MLSKAQYLKSENFKSCCLLVEDLSIADAELKNAIELSKAIEESRKLFLLFDETFKNYLRFYAARIIKSKTAASNSNKRSYDKKDGLAMEKEVLFLEDERGRWRKKLNSLFVLLRVWPGVK